MQNSFEFHEVSYQHATILIGKGQAVYGYLCGAYIQISSAENMSAFTNYFIN
jgi:hypothetical protein